ncbi:MAG: hypothetical protein IK083_03675 [Abditibacteriota bacterium]|nr:hypothetical protein [Abditibacteriota bacterium]
MWKEGELPWKDIPAVKPNDTYGPTLGISPLKDGKAPELSEDVSGNGDVKFLNGSESGKRYEALKGDAGEQNATRGPQKTNSEDSPVGDLKPQILTKEQVKLLVSLKIFAQLTKAEQKAIIGDANYELYKKGYDPKGFYYKKPNGDSLDDGFEYTASPVYLPPSLMEAFETPEFKKYQNMIPRIVELLNNMPDHFKDAWNDALKDFKGLVSGARNRYLKNEAKIQMNTSLSGEEFVCSLFHELGHALDFGLGSATNPATSRRPNMAAQVKSDALNMAKALSGKDDYDEAFSEVCGLPCTSEGIFKQMFQDYASRTGETRGLQDIINGSTNGKYCIAFGHKPEEWLDPQRLPRETLAQFFRIMVYFNGRLSPEFENLLKTYFKSTWDECDDIIRSIGRARNK